MLTHGTLGRLGLGPAPAEAIPSIAMKKLENKAALVTGAGRGIGRAIAEAFAREGANVAVTARTVAELDDLVAKVSDAGGQAKAFQADLADRAAIPKLLAEVTAALGPIDILVNNAGSAAARTPRRWSILTTISGISAWPSTSMRLTY